MTRSRTRFLSQGPTLTSPSSIPLFGLTSRLCLTSSRHPWLHSSTKQAALHKMVVRTLPLENHIPLPRFLSRRSPRWTPLQVPLLHPVLPMLVQSSVLSPMKMARRSFHLGVPFQATPPRRRRPPRSSSQLAVRPLTSCSGALHSPSPCISFSNCRAGSWLRNSHDAACCPCAGARQRQCLSHSLTLLSSWLHNTGEWANLGARFPGLFVVSDADWILRRMHPIQTQEEYTLCDFGGAPGFRSVKLMPRWVKAVSRTRQIRVLQSPANQAIVELVGSFAL